MIPLQLDLRPTVAQIRVAVPAFKLVAGAAELDAARMNTPNLPAAFVLPSRSSGGANPFVNQMVEQEVSSQIEVVIAVKNVADSAGKAALDDLGPIRNAVCTALLNWQPDADAFGYEYASGQIIDFRDGVLWWTDSYRTSHMIRSE